MHQEKGTNASISYIVQIFCKSIILLYNICVHFKCNLFSTANTETKSPDIIMKENIDQYEKDISDSIDECTDNIFENVQCDRSIYETPSKNRMCYAGDIKSRDIEEISPKTLIKSMKVLKKSCDKKDKIINRLRVQHCRQKKKIESLETLLHELRTKNLLSSTSSDIIKV